MTAPSLQTRGVVDSAELRGHHRVRSADCAGAELATTLERANRAGREDAAELLRDLFTGVPSDDRSRRGLGSTIGSVTPAFESLVDAGSVLAHLRGRRCEPDRYRFFEPTGSGPKPVEIAGLTCATDSGCQVDLDVVHAALGDGKTLILQGLDECDPGLAAMAEAVERTTGARVRTNAIISSGSGPGLGRHIDGEELWVVQLAGTKEWVVDAPTIPWFDHDRIARGLAPKGDPRRFRLEPGALLVLPRGHFHTVTPTDGLSVALNIALDVPSVADLVVSYTTSIGSDPQWLEPMHVASAATPLRAEAQMPTRRDLLNELARFRASIPARSMESIREGVTTPASTDAMYRSACGGGLHPVEDLPFLDTVAFAASGRVVRVARSDLPAIELAGSGRPFCLDQLEGNGLGSPEHLGLLVGDLLRCGLVTRWAPTQPEQLT